MLSTILLSSLFGQTSFYWKVIGIKDGDTLEILTVDKKTLTIRLNGSDAPEKNQAYGQKSKENLSKLIFGKQLKIYSFGNNRYGRLLADIYLDSINVNYYQVENGFAWHFKKYSKDEYLAQLENRARAQKFGLWQEKNPMAPWDFRKL